MGICVALDAASEAVLINLLASFIDAPVVFEAVFETLLVTLVIMLFASSMAFCVALDAALEAALRSLSASFIASAVVSKVLFENVFVSFAKPSLTKKERTNNEENANSKAITGLFDRNRRVIIYIVFQY